MPIYEYFCEDCNVVFSFLSKTVSPESSPSCPRCESSSMQKWMSHFSTGHSTFDTEGFDDARVEKAFTTLLDRAQNVDEGSGGAAAGQLMKDFTRECGYELSDSMNGLLANGELSEDSTDIKTLKNVLPSLAPLKKMCSGTAEGGGVANSPEIDPTIYRM